MRCWVAHNEISFFSFSLSAINGIKFAIKFHWSVTFRDFEKFAKFYILERLVAGLMRLDEFE